MVTARFRIIERKELFVSEGVTALSVTLQFLSGDGAPLMDGLVTLSLSSLSEEFQVGQIYAVRFTEEE